MKNNLNPISSILKPRSGASLKDLGKRVFAFSKIDINFIKIIEENHE